MSYEQYANGPVTTVNDVGGISNSATSLTPASTTGFPSSGNFRILIDSELIEVTGVSSGVWTIARGDDGTTAASHAQGATITHILTKAGLENILTIASAGTDVAQRRRLNFTGATVTDNPGSNRVDIAIAGAAFIYDTLANLPTAGSGNSGQLFLPKDAPFPEYSDGSNWHLYGPFFPLAKPPAASTWTKVNLTGTGYGLTDTNSGVLMNSTSGSGTYRWAQITYPTPPYTVTAAFMNISGYTNNPRIPALIITDGTKVQSFGPVAASNILQVVVSNFTNSTTFSTNPLLNPLWFVSPLVWLRIKDDNTNITYYMSADGVNWVQMYQASRTSFLTPSGLGWGLYDQGGLPLSLSLVSWQQTSP